MNILHLSLILDQCAMQNIAKGNQNISNNDRLVTELLRPPQSLRVDKIEALIKTVKLFKV